MDSELISVIIPMYNVGPYVERCVRSVLGGVYQNVEILCVDDGSTDDTPKIIKKLQEKDARIRLFQQTNAGVSAARNRGLKEANGAYIAFIDADDWVTSDYLSTMYTIAREKNGHIVNCGFFGVSRAVQGRYFADNEAYQVVQIPEKEKNRELVNHVWRALYRREICPFFNEAIRIGEDQVFNIRILSEHPDISAWKCAKRMYIHYWRPGSLMSTAGIDRYGLIARDILNELDALPVKRYAIIGAAREALGFRYCIEASPNRSKYQAQATELLKRTASLMLKSHEIPFLEKMTYLPFICSSRLYRMYRKKR